MKRVLLLLVVIVCLNSSMGALKTEAQWVQMSNGIGLPNSVDAFAVLGSKIIAYTSYGGLFSSTNNGLNWIHFGTIPGSIISLTVSGTNLYAVTYSNGLFLSTNGGVSWIAKNNGFWNSRVTSLAISGENMFAGTKYSAGVFLSTNYGTNWYPINSGMSYLDIISITISGQNIFAGTDIGGVYLSTNNGTDWTSVNNGLTDLEISKLASYGTNVYAATRHGGLFYTGNNGVSWRNINTGLTDLCIDQFAFFGSNIFGGSGCYQVGIFSTTNNGRRWLNYNQGIVNVMYVGSLLVKDNYIFAGTSINSGPVWRRSLSEFIGIHNVSEDIPSTYSLGQNYPNPFNPLTVIRFQLPVAGNVSLKVYDVQGRELQTLVNERMNAGTYEVSFDGSMLTSGVYFYRLKAGDFSETKKMLLIK